MYNAGKHMYICVCTCVCVTDVCIYIYVCVHIQMYVYTCVCVCVCVFVCVCVCVCMCVSRQGTPTWRVSPPSRTDLVGESTRSVVRPHRVRRAQLTALSHISSEGKFCTCVCVCVSQTMVLSPRRGDLHIQPMKSFPLIPGVFRRHQSMKIL